MYALIGQNVLFYFSFRIPLGVLNTQQINFPFLTILTLIYLHAVFNSFSTIKVLQLIVTVTSGSSGTPLYIATLGKGTTYYSYQILLSQTQANFGLSPFEYSCLEIYSFEIGDKSFDKKLNTF